VIGAVDVAADQVLQEVVAVEPAPALPQLGDSRPHLVGQGADRDDAGRSEIGAGDEIIAGKGLAGLLAGRAPPKMPGPDHEDVGGRRTSDDDYARNDSVAHSGRPCRACPASTIRQPGLPLNR